MTEADMSDPRLLSDEELAIFRMGHTETPGTPGEGTYCALCQPWPCQPIQLLDHLAAQADIILALTAERDRLLEVAKAAQVMSDNAGEGEYGGWEVSLARMDALDVALAALNPEVPNA
jgi:hypothetical protein